MIEVPPEFADTIPSLYIMLIIYSEYELHSRTLYSLKGTLHELGHTLSDV